MPKACWIAHVTVPDADACEACRQANGPALARFQGGFWCAAGRRMWSRARTADLCIVEGFDGAQPGD